MSINRTESISGADGARLWRVRLEVLQDDGKSRVAVAIYKPLETTGAGPNVLQALSYTWDDTRTPAEAGLSSGAIEEMCQMASDGEANYLEGWLEDGR